MIPYASRKYLHNCFHLWGNQDLLTALVWWSCLSTLKAVVSLAFFGKGMGGMSVCVPCEHDAVSF